MSPLVCKRIVVSGFVQGVGYRAYVRSMALKLGVRGRVRNLDDGRSVEIIALAPEEIMDSFIESLKLKGDGPLEPDVHAVKVHEHKVDSEEFPSFVVEYGHDMSPAEKEILERSEIGILAFSWMGKHLGNKIDSGFEKMGNKMDKGFNELGQKMDQLGQKMDKGFNELGQKMDQLGQKMEYGFSETGAKLDTISEKLDASIEKTEQFHRETVKKFEYLDVKYGEFGETMRRIEEKLDKIGDMEEDIREMKNAFIHLVDHFTKEKR